MYFAMCFGAAFAHAQMMTRSHCCDAGKGANEAIAMGVISFRIAETGGGLGLLSEVVEERRMKPGMKWDLDMLTPR